MITNENKLINLASSSEQILRSILMDLLGDLKVKDNFKYLSLKDCKDLLVFYQIIEKREFKKAFNRLRDLWKERALVPDDMANLLFQMFPNKDI